MSQPSLKKLDLRKSVSTTRKMDQTATNIDQSYSSTISGVPDSVSFGSTTPTLCVEVDVTNKKKCKKSNKKSSSSVYTKSELLFVID